MPNQITHESIGFLITKNGLLSSSTGEFLQIKGIQNFESSLPNNINYVNEAGSLKQSHYNNPFIGTLQLQYNLTNGAEEFNFGISGDSSLINLYNKEYNIFGVIGDYRTNLNSKISLSGLKVLGFANCFLNSYTVDGTLFNPISVTTNFEYYNFNVQQYTTGIRNPSINKQNGVENSGWIHLPIFQTGFGTGVTNLFPNNCQITVGTGLVIGTSLDQSNLSLESFQINFNLPRTKINKLGSLYPSKNILTSPASLEISLSATVRDYVIDSAQSLLCENRDQNLTFSFFETCGSREICRFTFSGMKISNEISNVGIFQRNRLNLNFEKQITPSDGFLFEKFIT